MKFKTTPYHSDLLNDKDRLAVFFEAINDSHGQLAYDLGCGSGILSYFLSSNFDEIISFEIDRKATDCARENLSEFQNVHVINEDVLNYEFTKKADMIVCEMLDTALIDEEEVPVLNHVKQFLKEDGKIIPQGIINTAELVNMEREYVHWDEEGAKYESFSKPVVYSKMDFLDGIDPYFEEIISFKPMKCGKINGLKITTYTLLTDNLICGPTPMLNPPLLVPLGEMSVKGNEFINVKLKYIMGNGIETIETNYV